VRIKFEGEFSDGTNLIYTIAHRDPGRVTLARAQALEGK
jgi:hypothetical protein